MFTGRLLDAAEAQRVGLVSRLAEPDAIDAVVAELAGTIAAQCAADDPRDEGGRAQDSAQPAHRTRRARRSRRRLLHERGFQERGRGVSRESSRPVVRAAAERVHRGEHAALRNGTPARPQRHLDPAQRAHEHQLVEVAEVTDPEGAPLQPAQAGSERQVRTDRARSLRNSSASDPSGIITVVTTALRSSSRRHRISSPHAADRRARGRRQALVAREHLVESFLSQHAAAPRAGRRADSSTACR